MVSEVIGAMRVVGVLIDDEPGETSLRRVIERNAIALLSNAGKEPLDPPSNRWLGRHSNHEAVRLSGLWNQQHVSEAYDPGFLELLATAVGNTPRLVSSRPGESQVLVGQGR
jgi:hypothetical protein